MLPGKSVFLLLNNFSPETHPPDKVLLQDVCICISVLPQAILNVKKILFYFSYEKKYKEYCRHSEKYVGAPSVKAPRIFMVFWVH